MKVRITGASNFVNRMFEACGSFQWAREFLKNSMEASATRVEFGIEWEAVRELGVYRRTVADDGAGMTSDELLRFFSTLGEGGKKIGGVHDNFGVGAKIASLPWNPEGVVVLSYKGGVGSMIWILLDEETGEYELVEFDVAGQKRCVIEPCELDEGIDWSKVAPEWAREHGTTIVLLGSPETPDTVLGNPLAGENDIKGLSVYLNSRFWDLSKLEVRVTELRGKSRSAWPSGPDERDDGKRPNNRRIRGARYYLTDVAAPAGKLEASGSLPLVSDRVSAEWYLWSGDRPPVHSYARKGGYIAIRYNGELFHLTAHKAHFRWFGVVESRVHQNLTIILEPAAFDPNGERWGVHPDQSRNRLIFSADGEKGIEIPLSDWGLAFADQMPQPILDAIRAARGDQEGSIDDAEYRKRLQDRFGERWTVTTKVKKTKATDAGSSAGAEQGEVEVGDTAGDDLPPDHGETRESSRRKRRAKKAVTQLAPNGEGEGVERQRPVDIPRYRYTKKEDFEQPWHLALWSPSDADGPTVFLNADSPFLLDVVHYHQRRYADPLAEDVANIVKAVFGEVAVAKVAHSQKLAQLIPTEELDREYRSERALTLALMGLLAEESLILQRLQQLGRARRDAHEAQEATA